MSYAEIEAELERLGPDELRRLALKSWTAFVQKEDRTPGGNECEETDSALLPWTTPLPGRTPRPARATRGGKFATG